MDSALNSNSISDTAIEIKSPFKNLCTTDTRTFIAVPSIVTASRKTVVILVPQMDSDKAMIRYKSTNDKEHT